MSETVLTTRRARYRIDGPWSRGRLRLTEARLLLASIDGGPDHEVPLEAVRVVRMIRVPRAAVVVEAAGPPLVIRCFEPAAIAALIRAATPVR